MLFPADPYSCTGTVEIPIPNVQDSCDQWQLVTEIMMADGTPIDTFYAGDSRILEGLPLGDYIIRYLVTDYCGGSTTIECIFRIADVSEPTAICDGNYTAYLDESGMAVIYTTDIDEGSYDNCGIDSILLRRVYQNNPVTCDLLGTSYYSEWGPSVDVNCCDAGAFVTVEMRVVDVSGNVNTCWLDVEVLDTIAPLITGIADMSQTCDLFTPGFDPNDREQLENAFGAPVVSDNCGASVLELLPEVQLSDCLEGTIVRRFVAFDPNGNTSVDTIEQQIDITNEMAYRLRFPHDADTQCGTFSDSLIIYEGCGLTVSSYEDVFGPNDGSACYVFARTYYVINWCEYDGVSDPVIVGRDENCNGVEGEEDIWVITKADIAYLDRDGDPSECTTRSRNEGNFL